MSSAVEREPSWLPEILTNLAMASGIGYVAAAYTVSRWLTRPSHSRPERTPSDLGMTWEPLECRTADAMRLSGWVVTPPRPRGTVVLFHGMRNNRTQTLDRTQFLVPAGYRCVAFDHRAHGESSGKRTSFGYYEGRDVAAVLDFVRRRWPHEPRAALGISMGAAALCFGAAHASRLDAIILESMYHDVGNAFVRRIGNKYPAWFKRLSTGAVWITERRLGIRLEQLAPVEHIGNLEPAPVLVLTGTEDIHAPPEEAEILLRRCRGPRELWLVPRAGHTDMCEAGGQPYRRRILDFLHRWLGAADTEARDRIA
ncbi:MAG: lysophospholipase [Gemmataceae bacterium]|nr:lysophospholipase [Gemmataceae bacterium]